MLLTSALTVFKATLSTQSKDLISKNKNDNENNSTLRIPNVDPTTSLGVHQVTVPQATAPSVGAESGPSPPGICPEGTSPIGQDRDRDARAYEHERQRAKHAGEWAKRRARKATKGAGRASSVHGGRRAKSRKVGSDVEVDVFAVIPQGKDTERTKDGLGAGLLKRVFSGENGTDAVPKAKVNLSEIMVLSQKKLRSLNVDDFEVIPHIRSVVALDDIDHVHDLDLDEAWEHVYGEEKASDGKFGRPSYARVAGTGCQ